jgi:hypothetical protein
MCWPASRMCDINLVLPWLGHEQTGPGTVTTVDAHQGPSAHAQFEHESRQWQL